VGTGLKQLEPRGFAESLALRDGDRRVVAVMIASLDGRTTIDGTSSGLGHPSDTQLLRELRTAAEVILVGAPTMSAEGYSHLLDDEQRERRVAAGRTPHPAVVTISRRLDLPDIPLAHEDVPFVVYTEADGDGPGEIRKLAEVTAEAVVADLGPAAILCEGGPHLLGQIAHAGLIDDLMLTVAPVIAGNDASGVLAGDVLPQPTEMALAGLARADDHLFFHYRRAGQS
jgi:riboflavin biosynthesis pyrimidine reductase